MYLTGQVSSDVLKVPAGEHGERQRDLLHGRERRPPGRGELDVLLDEVDHLEHVVLGEAEVAVELLVGEVDERVVPLPEDARLLRQDPPAPPGDRLGLFLQLRPLHLDVLDSVFHASAAGAQKEKIQSEFKGAKMSANIGMQGHGGIA